jgi:hypothetical protein
MVGFRILPKEWMLNWQKERKRAAIFQMSSVISYQIFEYPIKGGGKGRE